MVEGPRAGDVKEARAAIDWWENAVYTELTEVEEDHVRSLVVVAKAHLASQEQTPGITDEMVQRAMIAYDQPQPAQRPEWWVKKLRMRAALDAALVGFHPQPEGDKR